MEQTNSGPTRFNRLNRLLVPYDEVRDALGGIGRTTLWELIKDGHLTQAHIGKRGFVTAESLAAYVERITEADAS